MSSGLDIVNIAQKQIGFIEGPNNENPYGTWYGMPNQSYCYIVLKYNATPSHITHEAYHCVVNLFKWISASQEEELFAYHLGYVVGLIHKDQEKAKKVLDKQKNL